MRRASAVLSLAEKMLSSELTPFLLEGVAGRWPDLVQVHLAYDGSRVG